MLFVKIFYSNRIEYFSKDLHYFKIHFNVLDIELGVVEA